MCFIDLLRPRAALQPEYLKRFLGRHSLVPAAVYRFVQRFASARNLQRLTLVEPSNLIEIDLQHRDRLLHQVGIHRGAPERAALGYGAVAGIEPRSGPVSPP